MLQFFIVITVLLFAVVIFLLLKNRSQSPFDQTHLLQTMSDLRRELQETTNNQRRDVSERLDVLGERMIKNLSHYSVNLQKNFHQT